MSHWIVARTKTRQERLAAQNVARQGFAYYLPQYQVTSNRKTNKLKEVKLEVLFPCYLFISIVDSWRVLLSTWGISSIILRGDGPATMPEKEIERLIALSNEHGLVQLPKFKLNQEVKPREGPFIHCTGLYQGQDRRGRQHVLMDLLGGKRMVLFDKDMLEAA